MSLSSAATFAVPQLHVGSWPCGVASVYAQDQGDKAGRFGLAQSIPWSGVSVLGHSGKGSGWEIN